MICHELKCIFIHIPRCAGSSIEHWLIGQDWWSVDPTTKHLTARQAKAHYADYWQDYLTFSVVRNPVSRFRSCLKYADHFGLTLDDKGNVDFSGYHQRFGDEIVSEHDHRFAKRTDVQQPNHLPQQVFGNILDEPIDFIARFENLPDDMDELARRLGITQRFDTHVERSDLVAPKPLSHDTISTIKQICARDFEIFNFDLA